MNSMYECWGIDVYEFAARRMAPCPPPLGRAPRCEGGTVRPGAITATGLASDSQAGIAGDWQLQPWLEFSGCRRGRVAEAAASLIGSLPVVITSSKQEAGSSPRFRVPHHLRPSPSISLFLSISTHPFPGTRPGPLQTPLPLPLSLPRLFRGSPATSLPLPLKPLPPYLAGSLARSLTHSVSLWSLRLPEARAAQPPSRAPSPRAGRS